MQGTSESARQAIETVERWGAHNYHPLPVVLVRGEGVWVWDADGRRFLDMLSCYSALNQGHCHPDIVRAAADQLGRLTLTSRAFHNEHLGPLCQELCAFTGMEMALLMNTGAEAVETAIKAARKWASIHRGAPHNGAGIIACAGNFHGRTTTIVSFSTEADYREGFGPFTPGFTVVPYGDAAALEAAIDSSTAACLVEPIQGEAGVVVPPDGYLRAVREICSRRGILLILDEIQTGFGRTGDRFAGLHEGVVPDLYCLGKALGGGIYPVSAAVGRREVLSVFEPGQHGSTFGGNPLACAVARESLRVLDRYGLADNARAMGERLVAGLRRIDSPLVREVRGRGLLVGVELHPHAGGARRYCEALMERGILCKETHSHVIRFAPPLVITDDELTWALDRIGQVLAG